MKQVTAVTIAQDQPRICNQLTQGPPDHSELLMSINEAGN